MDIELDTIRDASTTCASRRITLFWENLTFKLPKQETKASTIDGKSTRTVVENLTGMARAGEIIGLLGPSGSGKTVLLNIFSDRLNPPKGSQYNRNVYVNNRVQLSRSLFGRIAAYVMQDDVLLETLTPYESLKFSANLRLPYSTEEKERAVLKVIADLRLQNCRDTLVGNVLKKGISGGERKRTSIGVEIVIEPSLIILDGFFLNYL
jgi:ABC-type multidrug transport system ATPase subunit